MSRTAIDITSLEWNGQWMVGTYNFGKDSFSLKFFPNKESAFAHYTLMMDLAVDCYMGPVTHKVYGKRA